jgi:prepilin-type N-terminal cleavage/methylation domain-containing protein
MKSKLQKQEKGFTIIEVLIVLAIAGLIILIVFLAVPALQRNSRNTQRRNDVSALLGAYQEGVNNTNGAVPADCNGSQATCWVRNAKMSNYDNQVAGMTWDSRSAAAAVTNSTTVDQVQVYSYAKCGTGTDNGNIVTTNATSRSIAVLFSVESSGDPVRQCQES